MYGLELDAAAGGQRRSVLRRLRGRAGGDDLGHQGIRIRLVFASGTGRAWARWEAARAGAGRRVHQTDFSITEANQLSAGIKNTCTKKNRT